MRAATSREAPIASARTSRRRSLGRTCRTGPRVLPGAANLRTNRPTIRALTPIHQDHVVCLDCGYRVKTLRRHISTQHGLSPDEYLKRWGLRSNHPLIAPGYSEHRSTVAKESGFGRKPKARVTPAASPGEAATPVDNAFQTPPPATPSVSRPASLADGSFGRIRL